MSEELISRLVPVIIILLLVAVWAAMIAFVYRDTNRRGLTGTKQFIWLLLSLFPLVGLIAYLMAHSDQVSALSFGSQRQDTPSQSRPMRRTQPLSSQQPMSKSTISAVEYVKKQTAGNQGSGSGPRVTTPPTNAPNMIKAPPTIPTGVTLTVTGGPGVIRHQAELSFGDTLIGAAPEGQADAYIIIDGDDSVSSTNARIWMVGGEFHLENLSRYGSWVNGKPFYSIGESVQLPADAQIKVGNTYLRLTKQGQNISSASPNPPPALNTPRNSKEALHAAVTYLLVVEEGPHSGEQFVIDRLPATIGRLANCTICLDNDLFVSRKHAEFYLQGGVLRLRDLGCNSGTSVNGYDIHDKMLEVGDKILLGESRLVVRRSALRNTKDLRM